MTPFQILLKSSGRDSLYMGVTCVVAGGAAAAMHGNLEILPLTLCLFFGFFAQMTINFSHRYNDQKYHLGENADDGLDLGDGSASTLFILRSGLIGSLLLTGMLALAMLAMGGWIMIVFAAFLFLMAAILNLGKHPLLRTPLGVVGKAIAYGPLGTISVCFFQSQHESVDDFNWYDFGPAVYLGMACAFLVANWNLIHYYSHYERDKKIGKRTMTVVIGLAATRVMIVVNAVIAFVIIFALCKACSPNYWQWLVAIPGIGVLIYLAIALSLKGSDSRKAHKLCDYAGITMLVLMLAIFLIICFTGIPFDTHLIYF